MTHLLRTLLDSSRVALALCILTAAIASIVLAQAAESPRKSDFAFLDGEWRIHHRYIRVTPQGREWVEMEGTCSHRELGNGWANVEHYVMHPPGASAPRRAVALRSYDPQAKHWTIWWLDERYPSGMETPMQGRFEDGVGTFYGSSTLNDKPIRVRFTWSDITATSALWQQAYSYDEGRTWETVWIMQFQRAP